MARSEVRHARRMLARSLWLAKSDLINRRRRLALCGRSDGLRFPCGDDAPGDFADPTDPMFRNQAALVFYGAPSLVRARSSHPARARTRLRFSRRSSPRRQRKAAEFNKRPGRIPRGSIASLAVVGESMGDFLVHAMVEERLIFCCRRTGRPGACARKEIPGTLPSVGQSSAMFRKSRSRPARCRRRDGCDRPSAHASDFGAAR